MRLYSITDKSYKILEIKERTTTLTNKLLEVWEDSVKATHLFLSSEEIKNIKKYSYCFYGNRRYKT